MDKRLEGLKMMPVGFRPDDPAAGARPLLLPPKATEGWYHGPAYPSMDERMMEWLKSLGPALEPNPPGTPRGPVPGGPGLMMPPGPAMGYPLEGRRRMPPGQSDLPAWAMPAEPDLVIPEVGPERPWLTEQQLDAIMGKRTKKIEIQKKRGHFDV